MSEYGYRVPPRSTKAILLSAERFLATHAPEHLTGINALDVEKLDRVLGANGVMVYPVHNHELPQAEAETRAAEDGCLEILMREDFYAALFNDNSDTFRARSTFAHELGHVVLHEAEVRAGRHRPQELALRRALRHDLPPYRDSEWQAFVFAAGLLVPRPALRQLPDLNPCRLSERFKISEPFVRSHLKRVQRLL